MQVTGLKFIGTNICSSLLIVFIINDLYSLKPSPTSILVFTSLGHIIFSLNAPRPQRGK